MSRKLRQPNSYRSTFALIATGLTLFGNQVTQAQTDIPTGMVIELESVYTSAGNATISGIPTGLITRPGGGYFMSESTGKILIINEGSSSPASTFLDLSADVAPANSGGRGLLSFNFHPDFQNPSSLGHRKFYTYHIIPDDGPDDGNQADLNNGLGSHIQYDVITEWEANADFTGVVANSRREVVRLGHPGSNVHSGGSLVFDDNNYLYLSHGTTIIAHAQQLENTIGTVIKIDPLDPALNVTSDPISGNGKYRTPADNPFVDVPGALKEVYAYGLRNPYRLARDPMTGVMLTGDVGQGSREEVSLVVAGGNNGWPIREGDTAYPPGQSVTLNEAGPLIEPLVSYNHDEGRSVTGGFFYYGTEFPELVGNYVFGDLIQGTGPFFSKSGRLFYFDPYDESGEVITDPAQIELLELQLGFDDRNIGFGPTTFGLDENGEILAAGNNGGRERIRRLVRSDSGLTGDYNNDGQVDPEDYARFRDNLGTMNFLPNRDASATGAIASADYDAWVENFGAALPPPAGLSVPEPHSALLLGLGLLACRARRRTV